MLEITINAYIFVTKRFSVARYRKIQCELFSSLTEFNPFMHNVVKWPNINYDWPFYNIMHERVNTWEMCAFNQSVKFSH